jgi:micrococcal nuclease
VRIVDVIDGDTVRVGIEDRSLPRESYTVRLIGTDAPETKRPAVPVQCGGREATSSMLTATFPAPIDMDADFRLDGKGGTGARVTLTTDRSRDLFDRYGVHDQG